MRRRPKRAAPPERRRAGRTASSPAAAAASRTRAVAAGPLIRAASADAAGRARLRPAESPWLNACARRVRRRRSGCRKVAAPRRRRPCSPSSSGWTSKLAQAESALQRGELASPPGRNAVELFRGALELDPANTLAKAGLVRVADRLLTAAERALTAGNRRRRAEDGRRSPRSLTPATARGAFLMMQIETRTRARGADAREGDSDAQDKLENAAPPICGSRNARAAQRRAHRTVRRQRALLHGSSAPDHARRSGASRRPRARCRKQLLTRAGAAASAGNAAETERWLANADGAGAPRQDIDRHPPLAAGHARSARAPTR